MNHIYFKLFVLFVIIFGCKNYAPDDEIRNIYIATSYLGFNRWKLASAPTDTILAVDYVNSMGRLNWYNPLNKIRIEDIWPDTTVDEDKNITVDILCLQYEPDPLYGSNSWGGIMQRYWDYIGDNETGFCEITIKGDVGIIHIDIGQISEDVIPNKWLDGEIINLSNRSDTGLDGIYGPDPSFLWYSHQDAIIFDGIAEPYDFWDINGDSIKQWTEPWSYDDWDMPYGNDYTYYNGTEGNAQVEELNDYDTEDLNGNGRLDLDNNYYTFSFHLEKHHTDADYIVSGFNNPTGWYVYRFPLHLFGVVGNENLFIDDMIRIWIEGISVTSLIQIAEIRFID